MTIKNISIAAALLSCFTSIGFAGDEAPKKLDLACLEQGLPEKAPELRLVLTRDEAAPVSLIDSQQNKWTLKTYAVVIRATDGTPPKAEWEILREGDFSVGREDRFGLVVYAFSDNKNKKVYTCYVEERVLANPALVK